ncbi:PH domain-containing protein [Flavobacteriales bacterium]|nr:PH domain-containing protein [Flavobacteriales bacterium]
MTSESTLFKAEFNPRLQQYLFFSIALILLATVVGIPLLLIWILGWGQWVSRIHYRSLKCSLTSRHLRFSKGHYFKTEKTIPLENIQDLTFIDNPLLKWFDLRILKVETAGNSAQTGADMKLVGILDAAEFKEKVMRARDDFQVERMSGVAPKPAGDDETVVVLREIHAALQGLREDLKSKA